MAARGKLQERTWRRSDGTAATIDDISVTVVPIKAYKEEYAEWKAGIKERLEKGEPNVAAAEVFNCYPHFLNVLMGQIRTYINGGK